MSHPLHPTQDTGPRAASQRLAARVPGSLLTPTTFVHWGSDIALTAGLFLVLNVLLVKMSTGSLLAMLAGWVMVAAMVLRRNAPLLMLGVVTMCSLCIVGASYHPIPAVLVTPLAVYSVARWVPGRMARLAVASGVLGSLLAPLRWGHYFFDYDAPGRPVQVLLLGGLCLALVVTPYVIGRRVLQAAELREQREVTDAQRASHSIAEREQQLRIDEANVRAQIARELHDIVAHSLSVIIVQAEGGKALATRKPAAAAQVLGTIAESGREALAEMRRIVSVLRDGPTAQPDYAPMPCLGDIPDLVARSGAKAHLDIVGEAPHVPQTLALTAYRVVQEALTNVLRHAGPEATAQVLLSYSPHLVVIEVVDNGRGAASSLASDGQGNGLRGMQERVASMGGQLVARPRSGGGFLVRALLPIVGEASPDAEPDDPRVPSEPMAPPPGVAPVLPGMPAHPVRRPDPDAEPTRWVQPMEATRIIPPPPEPTLWLPDAQDAEPTRQVPDDLDLPGRDATSRDVTSCGVPGFDDLPPDRFDITRPLPDAPSTPHDTHGSTR